MSSRIRMRNVEIDMDKKILIGMIVSTNFCLEISRKINVKYFRTDYSRKIAKWILDYFKKYKIAPSKHIKDIFETEEEKLKEEEADLIKRFLKELSNRYEEEKDDITIENNINVPYLMDQTIEYFKERSLIICKEKIESYLSLGKIGEAEEVIQNYKKVAITTSQWIDPFDNKVIDKVFDNKDKDNLLQFPGALGNMTGWFKRGWLVGFMGPMKRGKSWWLLEVAILSIMCGLRTVFISLEMSEEEVLERIYKRISALGDEEATLTFPCFDCYHNQDNTCKKADRKGKGRLFLEDGSLPEFNSHSKHKVCTYCRDNSLKGFSATTWFGSHKVKQLTKSKAKLYSQSLKDMFSNNLRVLAKSIGTTNINDIKSELENLEYTEDFISTTIVLDYADILGSETSGLTGREKINETWIMLKNLAQTKHALVVTGTQSGRKSIYKKNVAQDDTSEDIRKLAHVNALFTINQTTMEEEYGIMRIGTAVHRHKKSYERKNVMVLTQPETGQINIDSEYVKERASKNTEG